MNWGNIIAETPYDDMGREFQTTFGNWVSQCNLHTANSKMISLPILAFEVFQLRLKLAQKYNTFFATQMVQGTRELWRERWAGVGDTMAYSFAQKDLPRTKRFFKWCELHKELPNQVRNWDTTIAVKPSLPLPPKDEFTTMPVWGHLHSPCFRARKYGAFYFRRIQLSPDTHLIEHLSSTWVPNLRQEAQAYWEIALNPTLEISERYRALACFEWIWYRTNPFGRAAALTADALSLSVQKCFQQQGHKTFIRDSFYHQDCEALLLNFDTYVNKRINDMSTGFVSHFPM